ncbi:hypothetical protein UAJ10_06530 [Nitrospirillum sp. BR 11164]|uniref:hypothetical protein n=1 Tax=Nitrospirillum sp. BR 11164 TaxID=3104324 RepID=UPI002AFDC97C|nr:hypothetical protein [Nitrospirillum sp. BR 11164]MEA1648668.1 hypothetical protein [Nitrospirillum sp. BR 11164]
MKARQALMLAALAASAGLAIFGDHTPKGGETVEPAPRPQPAAAAPKAAVPTAKHKRAAVILALLPREDLMGPRDEERPESSLFAAQSLDRAPAGAGVQMPVAAAPATPGLPFTYLGKKYENAAWEVYLAIGDQTYFVREGTVIDQKYAVNQIRPPVLTMTYLPTKQQQTMTIGGEE